MKLKAFPRKLTARSDRQDLKLYKERKEGSEYEYFWLEQNGEAVKEGEIKTLSTSNWLDMLDLRHCDGEGNFTPSGSLRKQKRVD